MYRILIADDEGIMLESLKSIIAGQFGSACEVETAKTGRAVIEKAESFHPDVVFMDIHMPGINGIQAMKEIRKFNTAALFYIISAYDKFDYAKEAIDLGVEKYLTKPISKKTVISVMEEAMAKVDENRRRRSDLLKIQEKLETVIPVVENGFVSSLLFQNETQDVNYYRQLLDIEEEYAFVMVVQFGSDYDNGRLVSPVGMNVKAQTFYPELREMVKAAMACAVGAVMSNRIAIVVPHRTPKVAYEERIQVVEEARALVNRLSMRLEAKFRIGIGRTRSLDELEKSYREAMRALNDSRARVIHIDDLQQTGVYDEAYPVDNENRLFQALEAGDVEKMMQELNQFYDWMVLHYHEDMNNIRLKVLEYIIWGERVAFFDSGVINYGFSYRSNYLDTALSFTNYEDMRNWFQEKMVGICRTIRDYKEEQSGSVVKKAKAYIAEHFDRDISLDEVSREVNISPYYFSKVFKEESGENFIEYLTRLRMEKAREMLENPELSIKEVSIQCGYADPNYFSRIFKKQTDMTPREYKAKYGR